jgi:MFS family permease
MGVIGYIIYVGSLMYFDNTGKSGFPIFAGVAIGISAGLIFVTMGSIAMSYSEEQDRGAYITMSVNLQAVGSVIGGIIPLIINKNSVLPAPMIRLGLRSVSDLGFFYRVKPPASPRLSTLSS